LAGSYSCHFWDNTALSLGLRTSWLGVEVERLGLFGADAEVAAIVGRPESAVKAQR
jgi:hypothetical protein